MLYKSIFIYLLIQFPFCILNSQSSIDQTINQTSEFSQSPVNDVSLVGPAVGSITDLSWITGTWRGEAFDGTIEEIWSAPESGAMMGMFRLINEDEISFYELMIIREIEDSLILQLKHFTHTLKGWEDKNHTVDFPLVKISDNKVEFDSYIFEKKGENVMKVNIVIDENQPQGMDFIYQRQPNNLIK